MSQTLGEAQASPTPGDLLAAAMQGAARALSRGGAVLVTIGAHHPPDRPCWRRMTPDEQRTAVGDAEVVGRLHVVHVDNAKPAATCGGCELSCPQLPQ